MRNYRSLEAVEREREREREATRNSGSFVQQSDTTLTNSVIVFHTQIKKEKEQSYAWLCHV